MRTFIRDLMAEPIWVWQVAQSALCCGMVGTIIFAYSIS